MSNLCAFEHEDGELVVDSRLIAARLGIEHESFLETLETYKIQMQSAFGIIRFQTGKTGKRGRPQVFALLTEEQASVAMTFSRNTTEVVQCKIELVQAFSKAKQLLRDIQTTNATLKVYLLDTPRQRAIGRVFPEDFYREIYRLHGWQFTPGKTQHPMKVALITIDVIYQRLQPKVWEELTKKNPRLNGRRKYCCHQFLSENIGNEHLGRHLYAVTHLMRGFHTWHDFMYVLNRCHPRTSTVQLDILFELFHHCPEEYDRWKRLAS